MGRPSAPLLSVDKIADAAVRLIDQGGPFTVQAVARQLHVSAPSLYNHVQGRDHILELVRARLASRAGLAAAEASDWEEAVELFVRAHRRLFAGHPRLIPLLVGQTIRDPGVLQACAHLARVLERAGFARDELLTVISVLDAFALGSALDSAAPAEVWRSDDEDFAALLAETAAPRAEAALDAGIAILLDGLRARLRTDQEPSSD